MKHKILSILVLLMAVIGLVGCGDAAADAGSGVPGNVDRYFWGRWTQMDTGDVYQITDKSVTKNSGSAVTVGTATATSISFGGQTLVQESDNVARLGASILLFRDGGAKRSFTARLTGFAATAGMPARAGLRSPTIGDNPIGNRPTNRTNANNPADNQTVTSGSDGLITFTNAVAGDPQIITVGTGTGEQNVSITVTPGFDGQDMGTIPVVGDGYSFKVTSTIAQSDAGYLYGNNYNTYSVSVDLKNIGNSRCPTSYYEVVPDAGLEVVSGVLTGNYASLEPGASRSMSFTLRYGTLTEEYVDAKLTIRITDSLTFRTWVDYVVLRFYKRPVQLVITSENLDGSSSAALKGFLVHPNNRSSHFSVPNAGRVVLYIPWTTRSYRMVFSGAGASTEMKYSFVVGTTTAALAGTWQVNELAAYEPNDTEASRSAIADPWLAKKAFLSTSDIDFYDITMSGMPDTVYKPGASLLPKTAYGVPANAIVYDGSGSTSSISSSSSSTSTAGSSSSASVTSSSSSSMSIPAYTLDEVKTMVSVPGGTFLQIEATSDGTQGTSFSHTITGFKMGKYEVTYELWYLVYQWALTQGYFFAHKGSEGNNGISGDAPTAAKHEPVTQLDWRDVIVWCNAYSQMEGKTPVYCSDAGFTTPIKDSRYGSYGGSVNTTAGSFDNPYVNWNATGYRLPTEGEWQYAASFKDGSSWTPYTYASGATADYNDVTATDSVAWCSGYIGDGTRTVGMKMANAIGIYDLSGNVWEMCWDWYDAYPVIPQTDYCKSSLGERRVRRGGGYGHDFYGLQVGYRDRYQPYFIMSADGFGGFRLAQKQ